ncbi:MAG TPA: hypothetical protein VFL91_10905, partial [Thermomicrobiales bacterium]|nr:hypothetical protein [Thermomicrobiales bacterium]
AGTEPARAPEEAIASLEHQRGGLGDDAAWRAAGYPVGSGLVARAVAVVINRRMKRRGMRRKRANADAVVALRVREYNAAWDDADADRPRAA